ncbi:MAG: hypothetical protein KBD94_12195 [Pyrinomonadaceae bacterium]|nr:hypothetical protein [Pyrinomonadaceae bacterium]
MKNNIALTSALIVIVFTVLGCGLLGSSDKSKTNTASNKSISDKALDTAVGEEKIGIPECDEVMDMLGSYADNPDDGYVVKAGKRLFVNKIRETIKKSIEDNKGDKATIAKNCRDAKVELEKAKTEYDKSGK